MPEVVPQPYATAFNSRSSDYPTLIREFIHVERDLGCVSMDDEWGFDNYSRLAPAFANSDSKLERIIYHPGKPYGYSQTLYATHRGSLVVEGPGGLTGPLAGVNRVWSDPPGEVDYAGPGASHVWLGAPGGIMVQLNGSGGEWRGVSGQGQASASNLNALQKFCDYSLGAKCFIVVGDNPNGTESNLVTPPYYATPGRWNFHNLAGGAISKLIQFGTSFNTNHADHCTFTGGFAPVWVEDAIHIVGRQALQFAWDMVSPIGVDRLITSYAGGQIHMNSCRLQGGGYAGQVPTLFHLSGCEHAGGICQIDSLNVDGTLSADGFHILNFGTVSNAFETHHDPSVNGAATTMLDFVWDGGRIETAVGAAAKPWFRAKGGTSITLRNVGGLEREMFYLENMTANWQGSSRTWRPSIEIYGGRWRTVSGTDENDPAHSLHTATPGGTKYSIKWWGNKKDYGLPIDDDVIEVL